MITTDDNNNHPTIQPTNLGSTALLLAVLLVLLGLVALLLEVFNVRLCLRLGHVRCCCRLCV
jgi:hypothetical protein